MEMNNFKRIIITVDNTENSKKAVKKGAYLAKIFGIEVKIIAFNDTHQFISSVILEEKLKKESQIFLNNFKKIAENLDIKIETQMISGKPVEEIIRYVKKDDLLIIAYQNKSKGIDKVINKNISDEVIQKAPCSVFVIK